MWSKSSLDFLDFIKICLFQLTHIHCETSNETANSLIILRCWREYALVKLRLIFNPDHLFYRRSKSKGESIEFKFIKKKKIDKFEEDDFLGLLEIFKSVFFWD